MYRFIENYYTCTNSMKPLNYGFESALALIRKYSSRNGICIRARPQVFIYQRFPVSPLHGSKHFCGSAEPTSGQVRSPHSESHLAMQSLVFCSFLLLAAIISG